MSNELETVHSTNKESVQKKNADYSVILYNDEVNSFDYVTQTLIDVCEHDTIQAEQCTYITHFNGKCDVKSGELQYLRSIKTGLIDKGLQATIEKSE